MWALSASSVRGVITSFPRTKLTDFSRIRESMTYLNFETSLLKLIPKKGPEAYTLCMRMARDGLSSALRVLSGSPFRRPFRSRNTRQLRCPTQTPEGLSSRCQGA